MNHEQPVLTLIQQIKSGSIDPGTLSKEERQTCVEALILEGCSTPQIAQILNRSEKTIKRDIADIRSKNALTPNPDLVKQIIGNFFMKWEAHQASLMRLARSKEGSVSEKVQAEASSFQVLKQGMELLQTLGFLPQRPQQLVGDFVHHLDASDPSQSSQVIEATITEIESMGEGDGLLPEVAEGLKRIKTQYEQVKLIEDSQTLLEKQKKSIEEKEESDED